MGNDELIRPGTAFQKTPLGLWIPEQPEESTKSSDLPLTIVRAALPDRPTLIVAARATQPDDLKAYFAQSEIDPALGWEHLGREDIVNGLSQLPRDETLIRLAIVLERLWRIGNSAKEHLTLARDIFGDALIVGEMSKFCAVEGHVVFSEQALLSLASHAVVHCRDSGEELTDEDHLLLLHLLVAATALLHDDAELGEYDPENPDHWLGYLTQNLLFNATANFGSGLARTWRIFGELGRDESRSWNAPLNLRDLEDPDELSIEQQLGLAFGLYSQLQAQTGAVAIRPDGWGDVAQRIAPDCGPDEVVEAISRDSDSMREELAGEDAQRLDPLLRWASVPFAERPFLRLGDGRLLLVSPRALEAWPTDGVYYRLLRRAIERDPRNGAQHLTSLAGEITETYIKELLAEEHERAAGKHLTTGSFEDAQPLSGGETSDAFLVAGTDLVVLEISSSRITARTRLSGDPEALRRDLLKLVAKRVKQLDRTIEAFLSGEVSIRGAAIEKIERIFPVVINVEPIRWTAPLHAYLLDEVPGLLKQDRVQPLQFLEIEDLEALLSLLGPPSIADLIGAKVSSVGVDPDVQQWLHGDPTARRAGRPQMVNENLNRAFKVATAALGFNPERLPKPPAA